MLSFPDGESGLVRYCVGGAGSVASRAGRHRAPLALAEKAHMPTVEQCRAYAAEYKLISAHPKNSARRSNVLKSISRSWAALANQLESLVIIEKSEGE